jgi:hypothetical protein
MQQIPRNAKIQVNQVIQYIMAGIHCNNWTNKSKHKMYRSYDKLMSEYLVKIVFHGPIPKGKYRTLSVNS